MKEPSVVFMNSSQLTYSLVSILYEPFRHKKQRCEANSRTNFKSILRKRYRKISGLDPNDDFNTFLVSSSQTLL